MALKKKVKTEEVVQETVEEVKDITPEEAEAIEDDNKVALASTEKIALANQLLAHQFNIDDTFYVTKVDDKGSSLTMGFANKDYDVIIKIKNVDERF